MSLHVVAHRKKRKLYTAHRKYISWSCTVCRLGFLSISSLFLIMGETPNCGVGLRNDIVDVSLPSVCNAHRHTAGPGHYGRKLLKEKSWFVPLITHLQTKLRYSRKLSIHVFYFW